MLLITIKGNIKVMRKRLQEGHISQMEREHLQELIADHQRIWGKGWLGRDLGRDVIYEYTMVQN